MANQNNLLNDALSSLFLGITAETIKDIKNKNESTEKIETIPKPEAVKNAVKILGEEDCKDYDKTAAFIYYIYASYVSAGFSTQDALELTKIMILSGGNN